MKIFPGTPRRKRITFMLSVAAVAGLSMSPLMNSMSLAGIETGRDLMAMLGARSPGERPEGALLDTKLRRAAADLPQHYALPRSQAEVPPELPFAPQAAIPPAGAAAMPLSQASYVPSPGIYSPGAPFVSGPSPSTGPGGPGGPGPDIKPTPNPDPTPHTPTSAVPEPATWLNMLIGFGAIAMLLRSRRRTANGAAGSFAQKAGLRSDA